MTTSRPRRVFLVASLGGHLTQLELLAPAFADDERIWITFDHADIDLGDDEVVFCHSPTTRNVPNLIRNAALALRLLRSRRPDVVVSTGAGAAVPFFSLARLFGVRTVFVEVYDRIDSPTMTGRLVRPFTDRFMVQWREQRELYADAELLGPVYSGLEARPITQRSAPGQRVFVTVGTDHHPFDRLVQFADQLAADHPELEIFVQRGTSAAPSDRVESVDFLDAAELANRLDWADAVMCHGGPSTILEAIAAGHRPVVLPRSSSFGEHVDDHQQRFARHLDERDVITLIGNQTEADQAIQSARSSDRHASRRLVAPESTIDELRRVLDDLVEVPA